MSGTSRSFRIDGQLFEVASEREAKALLSKAEALASQQATRQAEELYDSGLADALKSGKADPVMPRIPSMSGVGAYRQRIERPYREAALAAELRILLALEDERDDEEAILLSI